MSHDLSFLEKKFHASQDRHLHSVPMSKILFWIGIVFFLWFFVFAAAVLEVFFSAKEAMASLEQAKYDATSLHFAEANQSLDHAKISFTHATQVFPLLSTASVIPFVGSSVKEVEALVSAGLDVTNALKSLSDIGESVLQLSGTNDASTTSLPQGISPNASFADLPSGTKQLVLARLQVAANQFSIISSRLQLASDALSDLSSQQTLSPFSGTIDKVREQLSQTQDALSHISRLADLVPAFAGVGTTSHHLILFLNNAELRPAGGFVGNYGILTVSNGDIQSIKSADVYALDRPAAGSVTEPAPYPLQVYNQTPVWFFRDANWSPDFGISAQKLIETFTRESKALPPDVLALVPHADQIDGVIAFTPTFASQLLKFTGPVTVDNQLFTADDITDKLEYQVEKGYVVKGIPEAQRKEVIGDLMQAVVAKLSHMPASDWAQVLTLLENAFTSRQFFAYHSNKDTESVLTKVGWGGQYVPKTPDVQLVVDANLASLKTDPVVERSVKYELFKNTSGELIGRTTITYKHNGNFDWKTTRYRTYTRLYTPLGSQFIRATGSLKNDLSQNAKGETGAVDVSQELGMTVFGTFTSVEPGTTHQLVFEYKIADAVKQSIANGTYDLTFMKQNGAQNNKLTLDLNFGTNVLHAVPAEDANQWGDASYRLNTVLDQDKEFVIGL